MTSSKFARISSFKIAGSSWPSRCWWGLRSRQSVQGGFERRLAKLKGLSNELTHLGLICVCLQPRQPHQH